MTIDIILFCYKQEQYIRQALESILTQEVPTGTRVRLVVADDHSPDNTLGVIRDVYEIQKLHTVSVTLCSNPANKGEVSVADVVEWVFLPEEPNMGISKNYKRSFAATEGEYVFILEGDDYWLPGHVMQHMAFWQKHPECSMMMNRITGAHEQADGSFKIEEYNGHWYPSDPYMVDLHMQIVEGNQLGNLSGCSFRGDYLRALPEELFEIPIADWMLGVMMAEKGLIGLTKESTHVYRVKASGVWAGNNRWQQHKIMLKDADLYDRFQKGKYHKEWSEFKKKCWMHVRNSWMHYIPTGLRDFIHWLKH